MTDTGFDWPALMRLGLHQLNLPADEFWAMTPFELMIKAGGLQDQSTTLGRSGLNALLAQYPDT